MQFLVKGTAAASVVVCAVSLIVCTVLHVHPTTRESISMFNHFKEHLDALVDWSLPPADTIDVFRLFGLPTNCPPEQLTEAHGRFMEQHDVSGEGPHAAFLSAHTTAKLDTQVQQAAEDREAFLQQLEQQTHARHVEVQRLARRVLILIVMSCGAVVLGLFFVSMELQQRRNESQHKQFLDSKRVRHERDMQDLKKDVERIDAKKEAETQRRKAAAAEFKKKLEDEARQEAERKENRLKTARLRQQAQLDAARRQQQAEQDRAAQAPQRSEGEAAASQGDAAGETTGTQRDHQDDDGSWAALNASIDSEYNESLRHDRAKARPQQGKQDSKPTKKDKAQPAEASSEEVRRVLRNVWSKKVFEQPSSSSDGGQ